MQRIKASPSPIESMAAISGRRYELRVSISSDTMSYLWPPSTDGMANDPYDLYATSSVVAKIVASSIGKTTLRKTRRLHAPRLLAASI
ncbi:MAG: hypothetical protein OXN84_08200 [Albidovulum sp.]|nr:hypothetical protein [Albidovulum sp.]